MSAIRYYSVIVAVSLIVLSVIIYAVFILAQIINMKRKIKWLEKNGFVEGCVDFCNHNGYKKGNIYFTDKEIQNYSLSKIKMITICQKK